MRIIFERTGGFMGRKTSLTLDLNDLPADQAGTLRDLLEQTNFLSLEESPPAPSPARDEFHYRVTVETKNIQHTVHTTDTTMPASLYPLIEELTRLTRL